MMHRVMLTLVGLLALPSWTFGQQDGGAFKDLGAMLTSLPSVNAPILDQSQALWLATMPLACIDRPQAAPQTRGYVWEATYRPPDDYQKTLAFYGCFDWHSSVNSV